MQTIVTKSNAIHFNETCYISLNDYLDTNNFSMIMVLVDENTRALCLPRFHEHIKIKKPLEIIEIQGGESYKTIETCNSLWRRFSKLGADRKSLLINLGGGVITDLGGFVASTFKRGIEYINIPTTLLSMVDASVGGKTGVDLDNLKNQIGVINSGEMVLIDTSYLNTLPKEQICSGMAEMLKHGLIRDEDYWQRMKEYIEKGPSSQIDNLIRDSVIIKDEIVTKDPFERNIRKTLNFGHTLGHAIESYFLENKDKKDLLHGEAIAIGMIMECYLSHVLLDFPLEKLNNIVQLFSKVYTPITIQSRDHEHILNLLKHDKKNEYGNVNFVLLNDIGDYKIDCKVDNELIIKAFQFYDECFESA
ncbi:MAG: 3-dehydroquinate synthase [Flavobacteriaceae bacterium]|nr:3-dehydroquinate synthase [Flavobacteriaceae bacterium]